MPNPKMGTVTSNVAAAVKTMKQGRVEFRCGEGLRRGGEGRRQVLQDAAATVVLAPPAATPASEHVPPPCRADKGGVVHAGVGKCSFEGRALQENIGAFAAAILAARPKGVKGGTVRRWRQGGHEGTDAGRG